MGPDDEIKHNAPMPPYRQLAGILTARIRRGDWAKDEPILSENGLMQTYGVSKGTVRRAINLLVDESVVFTVPHRGTYVK